MDRYRTGETGESSRTGGDRPHSLDSGSHRVDVNWLISDHADPHHADSPPGYGEQHSEHGEQHSEHEEPPEYTKYPPGSKKQRNHDARNILRDHENASNAKKEAIQDRIRQYLPVHPDLYRSYKAALEQELQAINEQKPNLRTRNKIKMSFRQSSVEVGISEMKKQLEKNSSIY